MVAVRNILFIMFDQLRFDYLSCAGHPYLETPHLDQLAQKGVRFSRCYVQSPICGASRMSFYTGRYVSSHGAAWNNYPLKVGEITLGDHLRAAGMSSWLVGKTHMKADQEGMARLGIAADSVIGARVSECGFDIYVRDDGLWASGPDGAYDSRPSPYNAYLQSKGYDSDNPWADHANAGIEADGEIASGWLMKNASLPANIREEDSETPWLTSQAINFIDEMEGKDPWLCHLSYIKPHWPYIVPAPYHALYGPNQVLAPVRHPKEREDPHPVYAQFMGNPIGQAFQRDEVRQAAIPAYMGLIKQCDDQMGRLFAHLEACGRMEDMLIVVTSDHGDYLGDHWLGEKDLFHEQSVKVPLIIYDPSAAANSTRGTVCDELVESIDLAATFIAAAGRDVPDHIVEGRPLTPFLHGSAPGNWREYAVSEYDYSATPMAMRLGLATRDARLFMIADKRWKFMHAEGGIRPMLFDLEGDPEEYHDLGASAAHGEIIALMYQRLGEWGRRLSQRTTKSEQDILNMRGKSRGTGVLLGVYDGSEVEPDLLTGYSGKAQRHIEDPGPGG
ncbi:MAG: sulfatase-like hydrolase/transferase [Alphaproteobacteria bacterium]|nr:sulfatase-like hydrolase/transferase [Alphaproteobacteria bacterium]